MSSKQAPEWGREENLNNFVCGMVSGARKPGLNILKRADQLVIFTVAQQSLGFTENGLLK